MCNGGDTAFLALCTGSTEVRLERQRLLPWHSSNHIQDHSTYAIYFPITPRQWSGLVVSSSSLSSGRGTEFLPPPRRQLICLLAPPPVPPFSTAVNWHSSGIERTNCYPFPRFAEEIGPIPSGSPLQISPFENCCKGIGSSANMKLKSVVPPIVNQKFIFLMGKHSRETN